jgi:sulfatase modifying factor 1
MNRSQLLTALTIMWTVCNVQVFAQSQAREGMVWIEGGTFIMGSSAPGGRADEYPAHQVQVKGFWMDVTEVTNAQFAKFVDETGYITTAEKSADTSSFVFITPTAKSTRWWRFTRGANWRHPQGPGSIITGQEDHPVTHVSYDDALAYCQWAGKRLPTEAEWEYAARGGSDILYSWGNEPANSQPSKANIWQGNFPRQNTADDGYVRTAPVMTYKPNAYGLYDMSGNVWEWCSDWYSTYYYEQIADSITINPKGPEKGNDTEDPRTPKRVIRGGSFLCHASYCTSYRVAARMKASPDTSLEHTGFRTVASEQ